MPPKTRKQAKFMSAVAHSPEFARKVKVPQSVGQEFHQADKSLSGLLRTRYKARSRGR